MADKVSSIGQGRAALLPALLLLATSVLGTGAMALGNPPPDGQMVVIGAPWWQADRMLALVAAAGGRLVDGGALPNVMITRRDPAEATDLAAALYAQGAWLVLAAPAPRGCLGLRPGLAGGSL